jgi:hypothetical protein
MSWSTVNFGMHEGPSLPQIILRDANYFFWALNKKNVFKGRMAYEAEDLAVKARAIKIPERHPERWLVEYWFDDNGAYGGFRFVKAEEPFYPGYRRMYRAPHLDLSCICRGKPYDKQGSRNVLSSFRRCYFEKGAYVTKARAEEFFNDDDNFVSLRAFDEEAGYDFEI